MDPNERNRELAGRFYRECYRIRLVEEKIIELYPTDKIKSPVHLSIGQESVAVGVCSALDRSDIAFGTYRSHALYLAKGGDLRRMVAELYGKETGCARGKAGSMHLGDAAAGMMATSAIVATSIPEAVGYALALQMKRSSAIVAVFFGDGAMDEGVFQESLNFAALRKLPILFLCENNGFAIYSAVRDRTPQENLYARAAAYGVPARRIETIDVFAIAEAAAKAVACIRDGQGPQFLECLTYRWRDHVGPAEDRGLGYRPDTELDRWMDKDEVRRLAELLPEPSRRAIERSVVAEVADAFEFAEESAFPAPGELYEHVFHG